MDRQTTRRHFYVTLAAGIAESPNDSRRMGVGYLELRNRQWGGQSCYKTVFDSWGDREQGLLNAFVLHLRFSCTPLHKSSWFTNSQPVVNQSSISTHQREKLWPKKKTRYSSKESQVILASQLFWLLKLQFLLSKLILRPGCLSLRSRCGVW